MTDQTVVRARIDVETKDKVDGILNSAGLNMSVAIRLCLKRIEMDGNIDFIMQGKRLVKKAQGPSIIRGQRAMTREEMLVQPNTFLEDLNKDFDELMEEQSKSGWDSMKS